MGMRGFILALIAVLAFTTSMTAQKTMVGHRGSIWGVENSKEAFLNGIKKGYGAIECDVKTTKDNIFIINHDDNLDRLGVEGVNIHEHTAEYLQSLELKQTRDGIEYTAHLCTLSEYLDICKEYNVIPVIELKYSHNLYWRLDDNSKYCYDGVPALIKLIRDKDMAEKAIILTSMKGVLEEIRKQAPEIDLQLLSRYTWEQHIEWCKTHGISIDIQRTMDTTNMSKTFHDLGLKVNVWTINDPQEAEMLRQAGVDMITTDKLDILEEFEKK